MHAAGICLGTIQARTLVQLALACQQSMIRVQHRLRLTMQHVHGHSGNLGNECADHAAALGTSGLTSNNNVITRWNHQNFDAVSYFDGCHYFHEILERLQRIRMEVVSRPWLEASIVFIIGSSVSVLCFTPILIVVFCCSQHFHLWVLLLRTSKFFICINCTES